MKLDLTGQRFGRLTAIRDTGKRQYRNALWLCKCDCGRQTIQRANTLRMGLVVSCGCYQKETARKRMLNEGNPMWGGGKVSLGALHTWVRERKPKPQLCERCGKRKPQDLANISGKYSRNVNDFEWLCRKCHMDKDGRNERRNLNGQFKRTIICSS